MEGGKNKQAEQNILLYQCNFEHINHRKKEKHIKQTTNIAHKHSPVIMRMCGISINGLSVWNKMNQLDWHKTKKFTQMNP